MSKLREALSKAGVPQYCSKVDISMDEIFLNNDTETEEKGYQDCIWSVRENPTTGVVGGQVVYAVPKDTKGVLWEAWYIIDNVFVHRVLSGKEQEQCHGTVMIAADDKFHPDFALGRNWYYYDDSSLIPLKIRKV